MFEQKYCVYMHKNKINGKVYIGATSKEPKLRWNNGKNYKGNKEFNADIIEYGWDNFEHIVVVENLDQEQSRVLERYYIKKYKDVCYNKQIGGEEKQIKYRNKNNNVTKDNNYYQQNRDKIIQNVMKNQRKNKDKYNAYKKEYYYANEEYHKKKIQYQRDYRKRKKKLEL